MEEVGIKDCEREVNEYVLFSEILAKIESGEPVPAALAETVKKLNDSGIDMTRLTDKIDPEVHVDFIGYIKDKVPSVKSIQIITENGTSIEMVFNRPSNKEATIVFAVDSNGNRVWFDDIVNKLSESTVAHF
jgi:hypothetical protein